MTKFSRKKPVIIDAITFEEFIELGKKSGANIVNGMPCTFEYKGHPVTYRHSKCYLIPTLEGSHDFTPEDMLITGVKHDIYPCKKDIFKQTYEPILETNCAVTQKEQITKDAGMKNLEARFLSLCDKIKDLERHNDVGFKGGVYTTACRYRHKELDFNQWDGDAEVSKTLFLHSGMVGTWYQCWDRPVKFDCDEELLLEAENIKLGD